MAQAIVAPPVLRPDFSCSREGSVRFVEGEIAGWEGFVCTPDDKESVDAYVHAHYRRVP